MTKFWLSIPAPIRSFLRVVFAGLVTWALTDGVQLLTNADLPPWLKALIFATLVPAIRGLDPTETSFGVKAVQPAPTGDVQDS